jgi:PAS domain S-box-containing protein
VSKNISELTGYNAADFENDIELMNKLIDPRDKEQFSNIFNNPSEGNHIDLTYRITTKSGVLKWVGEKRSIFTDESNCTIVLSVLTDIQRQDDARYNQEESINGYRILFDHNPSPMWIFEMATLRILKVNNAAIKTYGYTEQEFLTMTIMDLRLASYRETLEVFMANKGIVSGQPHSFSNSGVWKHTGKNGQPIYAEIHGDSINYKNHDCRIIVANNITQKIYYQEQVKLREQFLNSLIDSQTNFLIRLDINGNFTFVNKQFLNVFRFKNSELLGQHFTCTTIPEEEELCEAAFINCITNVGQVTNLVHKKKDKLGALYDTEWEFIAITDEEGNVTEVQGIGRDITELVKTNRAIVEQNEKLQNIASISSHELRRPVATMLGLLNIFDRNNFYNPDNREVIEHLLEVGTEIDNVIREIVQHTFTDKIGN